MLHVWLILQILNINNQISNTTILHQVQWKGLSGSYLQKGIVALPASSGYIDISYSVPKADVVVAAAESEIYNIVVSKTLHSETLIIIMLYSEVLKPSLVIQFVFEWWLISYQCSKVLTLWYQKHYNICLFNGFMHKKMHNLPMLLWS